MRRTSNLKSPARLLPLQMESYRTKTARLKISKDNEYKNKGSLKKNE